MVAETLPIIVVALLTVTAALGVTIAIWDISHEEERSRQSVPMLLWALSEVIFWVACHAPWTGLMDTYHAVRAEYWREMGR